MEKIAFHAGEIRLQSGKNDVFFSEAVKARDYYCGGYFQRITNGPFDVNAITGENEMTTLKTVDVNLSGENTVIKGFYEDQSGNNLSYSTYYVNVYLYCDEENAAQEEEIKDEETQPEENPGTTETIL